MNPGSGFGVRGSGFGSRSSPQRSREKRKNACNRAGEPHSRESWVTLPSDRRKAGWSSADAGDASRHRWRRVSRRAPPRRPGDHPRRPSNRTRSGDPPPSPDRIPADIAETWTRRIPPGICVRVPPCAQPCLSYGEWHGPPSTTIRPCESETQATVSQPVPRRAGSAGRPDHDRAPADRRLGRGRHPVVDHQPGPDDHARQRERFPAGLYPPADPDGLRVRPGHLRLDPRRRRRADDRHRRRLRRPRPGR